MAKSIHVSLVTLGLTLLLAPIAAMAGFEPPPGWSKGGIDFGPIETWTLAERKQTLAVVERASTKKDPPPADDAAYIEQLKESNNWVFLLAGIKNWKVDGVRRENTARGLVVKLRGSYLDSEDNPVVFEEWKFYYQEGFAQITHAESPKNEARTSPAELQKLLSKFAPFEKAADKKGSGQ